MFVNYAERENNTLTYPQKTELIELYNTLCSPERIVYRYDLRDTAILVEVLNAVGKLDSQLLPDWYMEAVT